MIAKLPTQYNFENNWRTLYLQVEKDEYFIVLNGIVELVEPPKAEGETKHNREASKRIYRLFAEQIGA